MDETVNVVLGYCFSDTFCTLDVDIFVAEIPAPGTACQNTYTVNPISRFAYLDGWDRPMRL